MCLSEDSDFCDYGTHASRVRPDHVEKAHALLPDTTAASVKCCVSMHKFEHILIVHEQIFTTGRRTYGKHRL